MLSLLFVSYFWINIRWPKNKSIEHLVRDRPLEKSLVDEKKQKTKRNMQRKETEKKIVQRRSEEKYFLQSELQCRVYKLYPPEWHLGKHFILQF